MHRTCASSSATRSTPGLRAQFSSTHHTGATPTCCTPMQKLRIVISGWEIAHAAVTRRPPIPLDTLVPRTGGYAYDVGVWDSSIVQEPSLSCRSQTLKSRFATFASLHVAALSGALWGWLRSVSCPYGC
jgi:hypothetical protein